MLFARTSPLGVPASEQPIRCSRMPVKRKQDVRRGKKGNPDYAQVTAYIPKKLHLAVKRKLIGMEDDFSMTVEKVLAKWVKAK
jgi:hypothetical protein